MTVSLYTLGAHCLGSLLGVEALRAHLLDHGLATRRLNNSATEPAKLLKSWKTVSPDHEKLLMRCIEMCND